MRHDCEKTQALFSDWYDGEAGADAVECAACRRAFAEYTKCMDEVRALPAPEVPLDFYIRAVRRTEDRGQRAEDRRKGGLLARRRFVVGWAGLAAACFVMAAVFWAGWLGAPARPMDLHEAEVLTETVEPAAQGVERGALARGLPAEEYGATHNIMGENVPDMGRVRVGAELPDLCTPYCGCGEWPPERRVWAAGLLLFGALGATLMAVIAWKKP